MRSEEPKGYFYCGSTAQKKDCKWKDTEERDHQDVMNPDEVSDLLKSCGLPHLAKDTRRTTLQLKEPWPEVTEPEDPLYQDGMAVARAHQGRGGLPLRLRSRGASSRGGALNPGGPRKNTVSKHD